MAQKLNKDKEEQELARIQRQELNADLAESFAHRPRNPRNRRRIITFSVLGALALIVGVFIWLTLLPSSSQPPITGIMAGTAWAILSTFVLCAGIPSFSTSGPNRALPV